MKKSLVLAMSVAMVAAVSAPAFAHCEIPCGIYGDSMRFDMLLENITTVEKSMVQINELSGDAQANVNQLVRWVENKEVHADAISEIVTQYFLTQRIKPVDPSDKAAFSKYQMQLSVLHAIMVQAMKAKQTTDLSHVEAMRGLVHTFAESYLSAEDLAHLKEHGK